MTDDRERPAFEGTGTTTRGSMDRRTSLKIFGGLTAAALAGGAGYLHWWRTSVETPPAGSIDGAAAKLGDDDLDISLDDIGTTDDGEPLYRVTAATDDLDNRVLYDDGEPADWNTILDEIEGDSGLLARGNHVLPLAREVHEYFGEFAEPFRDEGPQVAEYRFELHGTGGYVQDTLDSDGIERYDELGGEKDGDAAKWEFDAQQYYEDHFIENAEIRPYE